jgi:hypothetical protein
VEIVYCDHGPVPPDGFGWNETRARVQADLDAGYQVFLRLYWRNGHSLPADNDEDNLRNNFMPWLGDIANDPVFSQCTGYTVGNEPNAESEGHISASWVARCLWGDRTDLSDTSNAFQTIRTFKSDANVFVPGPACWNPDMRGDTSYDPPRARQSLGPDETYLAEMARRCYGQVGRGGSQISDVKFDLHVYGRTGTRGRDNDGPSEPMSNVPGPYGCFWGTQHLDDFMVDITSQNGGIEPPFFVRELNTATDSTPNWSYLLGRDDLGRSWLDNALIYINSKPNCYGVCVFVDEDLGGIWSDYAMQNESNGNLRQLCADYGGCVGAGR